MVNPPTTSTNIIINKRKKDDVFVYSPHNKNSTNAIKNKIIEKTEKMGSNPNKTP